MSYRVSITGGNESVIALLDEEVPTITDGYGGWQEVSRARRTAFVSWPGKNVLKMSLAIVLDGYQKNESVESEVKALERMAMPPGGIKPPPVVKVVGAVPHTDLRWVINGIEWRESIRNSSGQLVRQKMTITLWQAVAEDIVSASPAKKNKSNKSTPQSRSDGGTGSREYVLTGFGYSPASSSVNVPATLFTVTEGQSLTDIAASQLSDWKRWTELADMNGIRNPLQPLPAGTRIKVPE